jgi:septal ring-binding cell division protein DamX
MDKDQLSFFDENNFENGKKLIVSIDKVYIAVVIVVLLTVVSFSLGVERGKKITQRHDSYDIIKQAASASSLTDAGNVLSSSGVENITSTEQTDIPVSVEDAKALADSTQEELVSQVAAEEAVAAANAEKTVKKTDKKVDKKVTSKTDKKSADTKQQTTEKPKSKESYPYTVQIASYSKRSAAQSIAERLEKKGYKTNITRRGSFYILTAGDFKSKDEARKAIAALKSSYRDCFIRSK